MLKEPARERQVIFLTCQRRCAELLADEGRIIELSPGAGFYASNRCRDRARGSCFMGVCNGGAGQSARLTSGTCAAACARAAGNVGADASHTETPGPGQQAGRRVIPIPPPGRFKPPLARPLACRGGCQGCSSSDSSPCVPSATKMGMPSAANLNRTRLYVPARPVWGAVAAELASDGPRVFLSIPGGASAAGSRRVLGYLYPAEKDGGGWYA